MRNEVSVSEPSSYLEYLPAPYHTDPFIGRFLRIFESILAPIEQTIDTVADYLDPRLTPVQLLPWLAGWVGLELDENWPVERQRELVTWAVRLYRWRGTRRGLREHLRIYTGRTPLIAENASQSLGITVVVDAPAHTDMRIVAQIIEFQKPAHVGYTVEICPVIDEPPVRLGEQKENNVG